MERFSQKIDSWLQASEILIIRLILIGMLVLVAFKFIYSELSR